jgi:hypothetical protein
MKKLIALLAVALVALAFAAAPAPVINDARTVISESTDVDGNVTRIYMGRITCNPQPSGEFPVWVHFDIIKTSVSGRLLANETLTSDIKPLSFALPPQAAVGVVALIKAQYDARTARETPVAAPAQPAEAP